MSGSIVADLRANVNDILGIRDDIGAAKKEVFLVTRTWTGGELGSGDYSDVSARMLPSPRVVEYKHDLRLKEGGAVQQGDILLKQISQQTYPNQSDLDGTQCKKNVELFYDVGGKIYRPIAVTEKHLTWTVLLRPQNK